MIEQMLRQRSGVLYELNVYDDDTSRLLTAFNDRLRKACTELYKRVMAIYNEYIDKIYKNINANLAKDLLQKVRKQSPERFERIVLDLLLKMGYGNLVPDDTVGKVTPQSHDGGIDGIIKEDKLGLDNIYIQAKR